MKTFRSLLLFIICLLAYPALIVAAENPSLKLQAPLFDNLGSYHHPISTKNPLAQRFFDQGMVLYYGFEWGESIRSFREAARLDPKCGMCYWGLALSLRSKINAPMTGHEFQDAETAMKKALALSAYETPVEQDYIKALSARVLHPGKQITKKGAFSCHTSTTQADTIIRKQNSAYISTMKKLSKKYPQDLDAKDLYAAAIYWGMPGSVPFTNPLVTASIKTIKSVLAVDKLNIGANHYYIHTIEPYPHPENGLASADRLKTLVPGSEHLVHMPAHIYFLTGRYHAATEANLAAIKTFQQYNQTCHDQGFEPEINYLYLHNYDFLRSSAAMEGRRELANTAAKELIAPPFPEWLANDSNLQWFIPIPYYVKARFGMWHDILQEPMPMKKYQYAMGMWHYARGMAFANTGDLKNAKNESAALKKITHKGPVADNLGDKGLQLLKIADSILDATQADTAGNEKLTLAHLKTAMRIQDKMGYHEPPDWYFPVKEMVGDAYLKWGHPKEATFYYQLDLQQYPKNGWALSGLAKSLRQLEPFNKRGQVSAYGSTFVPSM